MEPIPLGTWNGKALSVVIEIDKQKVTANVTDNLADMLMTLPNPHTREGGFLHMFYVNPRKVKTSVRDYKGLGKAMLCAVVNKLIQDGRLQTTDEIELEASGGNCSKEDQMAVDKSTEEIEAFLGKYEGLLETIRDYYRDAEGREEPVVLNREDIVDSYCNVLANQNLVAYYKTFGFKPIPGQDHGWVTGMKGSVSGILKACVPVPKGGKKTRRRRVRK